MHFYKGKQVSEDSSDEAWKNETQLYVSSQLKKIELELKNVKTVGNINQGAYMPSS